MRPLEEQWRDFYAALEKLPDGAHKQAVYKYILHGSEVCPNLRTPSFYLWEAGHFEDGEPEFITLWWAYYDTPGRFEVDFYADGKAWWWFRDANKQSYGPEDDYVDPAGVPYGYLDHFCLKD